MSRHLIIVAYGRPAPQGSKDIGAGGAMVESSRFLPAWRERVSAAAITARNNRRPQKWATATGAVRLELQFTQMSKPTSRPDADKLARAVMDSLTTAGAYVDDSRVVDLRVVKYQLGEPGALSRTGVWCCLTDLIET